MRELNIRWLGKLPYGEAYILQKGLHSATSQESSPFDYLLLLEHNNVVTIGRSGDINNLLVSKNILNENNIEFFILNDDGTSMKAKEEIPFEITPIIKSNIIDLHFK